MNRRAARWALALASVASLQALAFNYLPFKTTASAQAPLETRLQGPHTPPLNAITAGAAEAVAQRVWTTWNAVGCASVKGASTGFTEGVVATPGSTTDDANVVPVWVSDAADPLYQLSFGPRVVALAVPTVRAGLLVTCDVFLNARDFEFAISGLPTSSQIDLETVLLHEVGHCLGLDHNASAPDSVMAAAVEAGRVRRGLATDDLAALCARYPNGALGAPCEADAGGCSPGLSCVTQLSALGVQTPFCSAGCDGGANACPFPLSCRVSNLLGPSVPQACVLPGTDDVPVGAACAQASACGSAGLCRTPTTLPSGTVQYENGSCTTPCDGGCPGASVCHLIGAAEECAPACRPGAADCRSGYACAERETLGACAPRCQGDADCGGGVCRTCDGVCQPVNATGAPLGHSCRLTRECGTGLTCLAVEGTGLRQCSRSCEGACEACPAGATCVRAGPTGLALCLRACLDAGCGNAEMCGAIAGSRVCVPACASDLDCAVGERCTNGACGFDAGCPACGGPDAGTSPPKPPGCGCGGSWDLPWVGFALLIPAFRRRRGQPAHQA